MTKTTKRSLAVVSVAAAALAVGLLVVGQAQAPAQPPPQRVQVTVIQLRPEMQTAWEDLAKNEMIPAQKKVGLPWRQTLANGASGQGFTRIMITPLANYAQLDLPGVIQRAGGDAANASYNAKVRPTIASQRTYIQTLRQDLSIQSNGAAMPLSVVQVLHLLPGKGNDFTASMIQDFLPVYKKAGVKDFFVFATNQGAPGGELVLVRPIAKYADLDQPGLLQRAGLSEADMDKINARRNALLANGVETEVYRFIPELSYGMPGPVNQTN